MGRLYDAYIEVGPRFAGFGDIKKQGDQAGKEYGKALSEAAAKAAEANVRKLGEALAKARSSEADASGKVRVAEQKLAEVRANGKAKLSQITAAEEALASAQRKSAASSDAAKAAAQSLEKARERAAKTAQASGEEAGKKFGAGLKNALAKVKTDDEGKKSGDRFGIGFSKQIPAIGGRVSSFFKTGIGAAAGLAAGVVVGGGFLAGFKEALSQGDVKAKFQAQLGLSDADAARAGKTAGDLYKGAYGESLGQVNDAIRKVVQDANVGLNSIDLKPITGRVLSLAQTFDQDLGGVTRATGQLMRTGLAKDATQALDIITRGFQTGADKSEDFLDTLNEYGTQFRKVGLDGVTATGLISQGLKAGARDADIVADAIKEFSIRAIDGSKTTSDGFKALGLNAEKMAAQIAKGGKPAAAGLDQVLDRLRKIKDPVEQSRVAVELFGTQAEDLGKALFSLDPSQAVGALGQVSGAAERLNTTVGSTPQQTLTAFFRTMKQGSVEGFGSLIQGFQEGETSAKGFPGVMGAVGVEARKVFDYFKSDILPRLKEFAGFLKSDVLPRVQEFGTFFRDNILPPLRSFASYIVDTVAPIVGEFIKNHLASLKEAFDTVRQAVRDNKPEIDKVVGALQVVAKFIVEQVAPVLGKLASQYFPAVGNAIAAVITAIGWMVKAFEGIKSLVQAALTNAWTVISGFFQDIIDGAATIFGWVPGVGEKLKAASDAFGKFRDDVNARLAGISDQAVNIAIKYSSTGVNLTTPSSVGRRASGGPIHGPGTGTSDDVPIMASNGEHMLTANEVRKAGGHGAIFKFREAIRSGNLGRHATGGPVGLRVNPDFADTGVMATSVSKTINAMASAVGKQLAKTFVATGAPGGIQNFRGQKLNTRTIQMLQRAEQILGRIFHITQGSYSTRVAASGSTHAGGGAMDTNGPGGWSNAVRALRAAGFAAWHRTPSQGPWGHHIHSIAIGDSSASPAAKRQVQAFLRGGDGLGGSGIGYATAKQKFSIGGPVKKYDTGGRWPPGTFGYNGTGKTETVRTAEQEAAIGGPLQIRVFIGDREISDIARVEVDGALRDMAIDFGL